MKVHAGRRMTVPYWDQETGIWSDRPEPVPTWILRTLEFVKAAHYETTHRLLEGLEIVISQDLYRELLTESWMTQHDGEIREMFGATFRVESDLAAPFEIRWISREEQVLQSLVNRL